MTVNQFLQVISEKIMVAQQLLFVLCTNLIYVLMVLVLVIETSVMYLLHVQKTNLIDVKITLVLQKKVIVTFSVSVLQLLLFYVYQENVHQKLMNVDLQVNNFALVINLINVPVVIVFHLHYIVFHHIKETELQLSQVNKVINMILDVLKIYQSYAEMALVEKLLINVKFMKDVEVLERLIIVQMVHV